MTRSEREQLDDILISLDIAFTVMSHQIVSLRRMIADADSEHAVEDQLHTSLDTQGGHREQH